jgi:hypothetical protein
MVVVTTEHTISSLVQPVAEGVVVTIFIVVTHLVVFEAGRLDGFFYDTNFFKLCRFETRRVDGLLGEADLLTGRFLEAGRGVNGGTGDTNFFTVGWGVTGRINRSLVDSDLLAVGGLWTGRVYSRLANVNVLTEVLLRVTGRVDGGVDADFFAVLRLEAGSIFAFANVDLSLVFLTTVWTADFDVYLGVVVAAVVWEKIGQMRTMFGKEVREMRSVEVWKLYVDVGC